MSGAPMNGLHLGLRATKRGAKHKPEVYASPIDLPESKSGDVSIAHTTIQGEVYVISFREALLRGLRPTKTHFAEPRRVHHLCEGERVWMTDLPCELNQIAEAIATAQPFGRVLVGGLGLGILPKVLSGIPRIRSVTVVERSADVINLCAAPGYAVVYEDLRDYLKASPAYDFYMLDTWRGTSEGTWWEEVLPLRRLIRQHHGAAPKIHCWAEDVMWGQVERALSARPHWLYDLPMMSRRQAIAFRDGAGTPAWEKKYGPIIEAKRT